MEAGSGKREAGSTLAHVILTAFRNWRLGVGASPNPNSPETAGVFKAHVTKRTRLPLVKTRRPFLRSKAVLMHSLPFQVGRNTREMTAAEIRARDLTRRKNSWRLRYTGLRGCAFLSEEH